MPGLWAHGSLLAIATGLVLAVAYGAEGTLQYVLSSTPALDLFSDDILFYKSFDDPSPLADMAAGEGKPSKVEGKLRLRPGLWGKAMLFGDGEGAALDYAMAGNMPVPRPGALSFWICPVAWERADDEPSIVFFLAAGRGVICLQRQGALEGGRKRNNCFAFTCHGLPGIPNVTASTVSGATKSWKNGEWHLIVVNWRPALLEAYLDGEPLRAIALKRPIRADEFATGRFRLGSVKGEPTLLDDFAVYRRPLSAAEVGTLWGIRGKRRRAP